MDCDFGDVMRSFHYYDTLNKMSMCGMIGPKMLCYSSLFVPNGNVCDDN